MPDLSQQTFSLPTLMQPVVESQWQKFIESLDEAQTEVFQKSYCQPELIDELGRVWAGSEYVANHCIRSPDLLLDLLNNGDLLNSYSDKEYIFRLTVQLENINDEAALSTALRKFRQREMVRIIWRDLLRHADMQETTRDLSLLADACIDQTLDWLYQQACEKWGIPVSIIDGQQVQQRMVVLGMGKLGAYELNLSSDIDLIFAFEGKGETQGGKRPLENQQFFTRLGQKLIQMLDNRTAEGFVFRVDMRLRPYGQSGALVLNFDAMLEYYQTQGRDWERYAMIKARVVAGDQAAGAKLIDELRPFVYRRYLDFGAIDALRSMKELIRKEEQRRGLQNNVKLGSGGIREIEFIAQVFQLIRGGRDTRLQERGLMTNLSSLAKMGILPEEDAEALQKAYVFLRNTEHAIQAVRDEQTQQLPESEIGQARLAFSMGFDSSAEFCSALDQHRSSVHDQFNQLIATPENNEDTDDNEIAQGSDAWQAFWNRQTSEKRALALLEEQGFTSPQEALEQLQALQASRKVQGLQPISQERLTCFMPLLLQAVAETEQPQQTLNRVLLLVESVLRRTAYLVLLVENPVALQQLVKLCSASPWIADELAKHPILLDELLDVNDLYTPSGPQILIDELRQQLLRIEPEDTEQQMDCLRYFRRAHVLRVAASEVGGVLPLMKVSDYLTYIAEAVLFEVFQMAWTHLGAKYGFPQKEKGVPCDPDFIVVAYGKLGGLELSYGSDLDLVFLHDAPNNLMTDGERSIENSLFFTRLAQRMIHLLSAQTSSGQLYEVDMRLRPSGAAGLLVSSLQGFVAYQKENAWTWEHQALVRARVVMGSISLQKKFEKTRAKILAEARDEAELRRTVVEMRQKIRDTHGSNMSVADDKRQFHLKYDEGGIVDIEFIVQYAVLAWSQTHPELLQYTDNIRILDAIEQKGLMVQEDTESLREAYKAFRSVIHRLTLDQQPSRLLMSDLKASSLEVCRKEVVRIWQQVMDK